MKKNEASVPASPQRKSAATYSLAFISVTVILAGITHAAESGTRAYVAAMIIIVMLWGIGVLCQRTGKKVFLVFYGLLNAWVIVGFGLLNGFWNHSFKVFLYYLHNDSLPPFLAKLFMTPEIGSVFVEGAGVLSFITSMLAAYYGYEFLKEGR